MTYLEDFKGRWEANEKSPAAIRARRSDLLCRELVATLATADPTDLSDWPRIAELIEAAKFVCQSLSQQRKESPTC